MPLTGPFTPFVCESVSHSPRKHCIFKFFLGTRSLIKPWQTAVFLQSVWIAQRRFYTTYIQSTVIEEMCGRGESQNSFKVEGQLKPGPLWKMCATNVEKEKPSFVVSLSCVSAWIVWRHWNDLKDSFLGVGDIQAPSERRSVTAPRSLPPSVTLSHFCYSRNNISRWEFSDLLSSHGFSACGSCFVWRVM